MIFISIAVQLGFQGSIYPSRLCVFLCAHQDSTPPHPKTLITPLEINGGSLESCWIEAWQSSSFQDILWASSWNIPHLWIKSDFMRWILHSPRIIVSIGIRASTCRAWTSSLFICEGEFLNIMPEWSRGINTQKNQGDFCVSEIAVAYLWTNRIVFLSFIKFFVN